jgi:hypothetical protein
MKNFKEFIEEARSVSKSSSNIIALASDVDTTDELRSVINEKYKITKDIPKIKGTNPVKFAKDFNKLLLKYTYEFDKIFNDVPTGVGQGEVLLSYLSDEITIGGGSSNFDVLLGSNKIEVKGVSVDKLNFGYNFRLGVDSRGVLISALKDLKSLYKVAKFYIPEIDNAEILSKIDRGELTSLKKHLKKFNPSKAAGFEKLDITVFKNQEVWFKGSKIGSLSDAKLTSNLKTLASTEYTKILSYNEIEQNLSKNLADHNMKYYFFNKHTIQLHYKERLSGTVIDTITGGSIKVRVPLV